MTTVPDESERSQRPWSGNLAGELRWHAELVRLLADPVWRGAGVPHGHGEPVMVVPGLLSGDRSTHLLRRWLRRIGYQPHPAGMTLNIDCSARALAALERRVNSAAERGGGSIALIGHSRGGILARALATQRPDLVHRVIALGSGLDNGFDISLPLRIGVKALRSYRVLTTDRAAKHGCMTQQCECLFGVLSRAAFPDTVELISIYSRQDGMSHWRSSRVSYAQNVEVTGSHIGLVSNRLAYRAVALGLAGRIGEFKL